MNSKGKEAAQRFLAVLVIIAMLGVMGLPFSVIIFFATVTYFIWRAVQRSDNEDARRIFDFYVRANDVLRDAERKWYGFEIASIVDHGERVVHSMVDPPPLVHYALGALYSYAGDHERATEHLAFIVENEMADERRRYNPSSELRSYVEILRKLERSPAEGPQTIAAIRNLDRERRHRAATLLEESREKLKAVAEKRPAPALNSAEENHPAPQKPEHVSVVPPRVVSTSPPPPIAEVLRDLYEEKKTA
jgi:hypothetical protein